MAKKPEVIYSKHALEDLQYWQEQHPKMAERIMDLIDAIHSDPYQGMGKPEPLRYKFSGYWSRRINREHRLVYKVDHGQIYIVQCRYHY